MKKRVTRGFVTIVGILILSLTVHMGTFAYGPGCPAVPNQPAVISTNAPVLDISIRWCGILEAPSVNNPWLACKGDPSSMLWGRLERSSDTIWAPQCRIDLRPGTWIQKSDYVYFNDLALSPGSPGDIVISPSTELINTFIAGDTAWNPQPKGILAISCNRLINSSGTSIARGVAVQGSITSPWLAVADPTVFCQHNERSLAHEVGHVLGLGHTSGLMQSGGNGATLSLSQCNDSRAYLVANTILDPPLGPVNLADYLFDTRGDSPSPFLDISKIVVQDNSPSGGDLTIALRTEGLHPETESLDYWIALDTDNNPGTGIAPSLIPGANLSGVDAIAQIHLDPAPAGGPAPVSGALYIDSGAGFFLALDLTPGLVTARVRHLQFLIDPAPGYAGPTSFPFTSEADIVIGNAALSLLPRVSATPAGGLFPNGLCIQAVGDQPGTPQVADPAPDNGGVLNFPEIVFPSMSIPDTLRPDGTVELSVSDLSPNSPLTLFLCEKQMDIPGISTDENGEADITFTLPRLRPGSAVVTVGIDDPNNAMTASAVVNIPNYYQPDLYIGSGKNPNRARIDDRYNNGAGQVLRLRRNGRDRFRAYLFAENDGNVIDTVTLRSRTTRRHLHRTRIFRLTGGKTNITAEVRSGAGAAFADLVPGEKIASLIEFRGGRRPGNHKAIYTGRSANEAAKRDTNKLRVKLRP